MKKRLWMGAFAAAGLFGSIALAQGQQPGQQGYGQQQSDQQHTGQMQMQMQQQAQVEGEVVQMQKERGLVYLKLDQGAVIPLKVTSQTKFQGQEPGQQQRGLEMLQVGSKVSASAVTQQGANVARSVEIKERPEKQEITGKVASAKGDWLNLNHEGVLIPLKVERQTKFQGGEQGRQIRSLRDLSEGDEVRASFNLQQGTQNVAERIELQSQDRMQQDRMQQDRMQQDRMQQDRMQQDRMQQDRMQQDRQEKQREY